MRQMNMSYTGPMLDVEPQRVNQRPDHGMVAYGGATSFGQSYNIPTILPPPRYFNPVYLPEDHGYLPYVMTQYNSERCNTFMLLLDSGRLLFVPVNSHLVHGGHAVQALPIPWLEQRTWNHSHGVPFMQGGIVVANMGLHGTQIPAMSRNSMPLMHLRPVRPLPGSRSVYHPTPPLSGIGAGPSSMPIPAPPPGLSDFQARNRGFTIGFTLAHHGFTHLRVLPQHELLALGEQIGSDEPCLSNDFISDHLRTRVFSNLEDVAPGAEKPNLCVICQMEFEDQEKIGILDCRHEYHEECIKKWLAMKNNCPICKSVALA